MNTDINLLRQEINLPDSALAARWERITLNDFFNESGIVAVVQYKKRPATWVDCPTNDAANVPYRVLLRAWIPDAIQNLFTKNQGGNSFQLKKVSCQLGAIGKPGKNHGFYFWEGNSLFIWAYGT